MNKYSKRALKTTATIGMSLAMVLSGVAAPVMAYSSTGLTCVSSINDEAVQLLAAIKADLKTADMKIEDLALDATANNADTPVTIAWAKVKELGDTLSVDALKNVTTLLSVVTAGKDILGKYVNCAASPDSLATTLAGVKDEATTTDTIVAKVGLLEKSLGNLESKKADFTDKLLNDTKYADLKKDYDIIVAYYDDYKGNINNSKTPATLIANYDKHFGNLEASIDEYEGSYIGDISDDFVKGFKKALIIDNDDDKKDVSVDDLVNGGAKFNYSNLDKLEKFIKDLKDDKITIDGTSTKYSKVSGEDDVVELVEGLEAVVEDLKEVKDLLKSTSSTVKAYKGLNSKINTLAAKVNVYDADDAEKVKEYRAAMAAFTEKNIEALNDYVNDVVENFFTVEAVLRTSGNYTLRLKNADFARYVDETEVINDKLNAILTTNLVKDEETSVYDSFAGNVDETEKLMAAVAAIEKIQVGSTFTTAEANTILAARKALNELDVIGTPPANPYGLSSKEIRKVKSNADIISALYTKLILSGTITESGWIDKGAGNWDYINADGSKSTKWVAAGKDWYFVQNGTMLRSAWVAQDATGAKWYYVDNAGKMVSNTTIDGFVIDANGVWTK